MGKLVVSLDGVVIKEVQLTKDKTSLGRRPYNDIVIDNLAVSGEHAVLQMVGSDVFIEDLNSTNGTYINGRAVKKQLLQNNDTVEIGKYKIKFIGEEGSEFEKTMIMRHGSPAAAAPSASPLAGGSPMAATRPAPASPAATYTPHAAGGFGHSMPGGLASGFGGLAPQAPALIKVLNGAAAGREVQAGRAGGLAHQASGWLCVCARGRRCPPPDQWIARGGRPGAPQEWRHD